MERDDGSEHSATLEQRTVSATPNVLGLFWPICWSKKKAQNTLMMDNTLETWSNKGIEKKLHIMRQCIITKFIMLFDPEFHLEKYYNRMLTSHLRILVNKHWYSGQYTLFGNIYIL